jgi:hypothetical protein
VGGRVLMMTCFEVKAKTDCQFGTESIMPRAYEALKGIRDIFAPKVSDDGHEKRKLLNQT